MLDVFCLIFSLYGSLIFKLHVVFIPTFPVFFFFFSYFSVWNISFQTGKISNISYRSKLLLYGIDFTINSAWHFILFFNEY